VQYGLGVASSTVKFVQIRKVTNTGDLLALNDDSITLSDTILDWRKLQGSFTPIHQNHSYM